MHAGEWKDGKWDAGIGCHAKFAAQNVATWIWIWGFGTGWDFN